MTSIKHDNDAGLAGFMAGWDKRLQENEQLPVGIAILVLTNFGERAVDGCPGYPGSLRSSERR